MAILIAQKQFIYFLAAWTKYFVAQLLLGLFIMPLVNVQSFNFG